MIYQSYTEHIRSIVSENKKRKSQFTNFIGKSEVDSFLNKSKILHEQRLFGEKSMINFKPLKSLVSVPLNTNTQLGLHPDFSYIKGTDLTAYHYIVSVFLDIKGSTNLFKAYELEDIFRITNTIQSAAIHTCLSLGGYIQRLQGDGVFAYFGSKKQSKEDAVKSAVIACSMISYFVKNDLKNVFLEDGIEDIKTRIGIDFGDDDKVLWANFGVSDLSELTTLSLHTSLASKMQQWAKPNGIIIGDNIKNRLVECDQFCETVRNSNGEVIKEFIYEDSLKNYRYKQWEFDWYRFLKALPNVKHGRDGSLFIDEGNNSSEDKFVTPKNYESLATLVGNNRPYGL